MGLERNTGSDPEAKPGKRLGECASVSFAHEELLRVDRDDCVVGYATKAQLHAGAGQLHRAFSVFLFDRHGRLLIHRRSAAKPLWPGFWTNSCCSHPRRGEQLEDSVRRRVREELGVDAAALRSVYRFEYHAEFGDAGSEHELCHVFLARLPGEQVPRVHPEEIDDWDWYTGTEVDAMLRSSSAPLTPWFCMEWQALRAEHNLLLETYLTPLPNGDMVAA